MMYSGSGINPERIHTHKTKSLKNHLLIKRFRQYN